MRNTRRQFLKVGALGLLGLGARTGLAAAARFSTVDFGSLCARVDFRRRSEWTSDIPCGARLGVATTFSRMTVHHTGAVIDDHGGRIEAVFALQGVLHAHAARNYGDIGYHFAIDHAGRVWEGRSLRYEGAHVSGENRRNIGVMLLGNFEVQKPTGEQTCALTELARFLMGQYGIGKDRVYGHCDLGQSLCPGRYLYPHVVALRA